MVLTALRCSRYRSSMTKKKVGLSLETVESGKRTAQPNGKDIIVCDMRIAMGHTNATVRVVLLGWSSVRSIRHNLGQKEVAASYVVPATNDRYLLNVQHASTSAVVPVLLKFSITDSNVSCNQTP